jgi:hypothetical protein
MAVLDQYQLDHSSWIPAGVQWIYDTRWLCQTFKAGASGNLTELHLWMMKSASDPINDLIVEIRNVISDYPGSTILATTTIPKASFSTDGWGAEVIATFLTPASVVSGTSYAIVCHQVDGDMTHCYDHFGKSVTNPYPDGKAGRSFDSGSSWTMNDVNDLYFETYVENPTKIKTILSDTKIKVIGQQQTILSDAIITNIINKTILSDTKIKVIGDQKTITSDTKVVDQYQETILSDTKILAIGIQKTILSDAKIAIEVLYDIINKFIFTKQVLSDINNKVNTVIRVFSNINNFINTCKSVISDVTNDFRTQKLTLNNITNDVRFMHSWQKATNGTIQSLGKEYIKVYIGGIEQIDIDIDSISISKDINTSHTATFDLGRAYDATKPTIEATVSIRYYNNSYTNYWELYSGYITQISPAEDPEKIRINCQNKYWEQNKTNVYYHIGHKPTDDKELYYETLAVALTAEHSWTPGIGNFTPETMDNFAVGKSDAITNLIKEMGNYGWFYDVDGTKKLWTAGEGSIIELERQILGENINLYNIINHSFDESVEDIVNKFRVQMGNKIVQKDNRTRTYTGYNYSSYHQFVTPAWDNSLELLSNQTGTGYGFDHRNPALDYSDVFTKYNMPYLNPELSSWSDRYPPYIEIYNVGNAFGFVGLLNLERIETIKEGFTIDYENKTIKFNEPKYLYQTDANGECIAVRAPIIKVFLWKKDYYTYTSNPTDDPETDISNPLMFFTGKMGDYDDTIIKDLNLSNLSIQVGYVQHNYATGVDTIIPSWDDTAFAYDIADWELSKICDKKITGTITITLDALCFYNIDLSKRIYIAGITDEAMNITGITYNISSFAVSLTLENSRYYNRSISIQNHGE